MALSLLIGWKHYTAQDCLIGKPSKVIFITSSFPSPFPPRSSSSPLSVFSSVRFVPSSFLPSSLSSTTSSLPKANFVRVFDIIVKSHVVDPQKRGMSAHGAGSGWMVCGRSAVTGHFSGGGIVHTRKFLPGMFEGKGKEEEEGNHHSASRSVSANIIIIAAAAAELGEKWEPSSPSTSTRSRLGYSEGEQHFQGGNLALHTVSSIVFGSLVQQSPLKVALILVWIRPPSHIPFPPSRACSACRRRRRLRRS